MTPWVRALRRTTLPEKEALADAEAELLEAYEALEEKPGVIVRDEDEAWREVVEEQAALREILQEQKKTIDELQKRLTDEAICATFLASSVGRQIIARCASLDSDNNSMKRRHENVLTAIRDTLTRATDIESARSALLSLVDSLLSSPSTG